MGNNLGAGSNFVGGKSMIYLPGFIRNRLVWSVGEAERLKGSAPTCPECVVVY
jgi:hypothetical protein